MNPTPHRCGIQLNDKVIKLKQRLRSEGIFRPLKLVGVLLYGRDLKGGKQAVVQFC